MINSGANSPSRRYCMRNLATKRSISSRSVQHRCWSDAADRSAVFESERRLAIGTAPSPTCLLNFGMVHDAAESALDVYFRQCSILVSSRDLACGRNARQHGSNPMTPADGAYDLATVRQHDGDHVHVRDVRLFRGMAYRVGVPAKSGVAAASSLS